MNKRSFLKRIALAALAPFIPKIVEEPKEDLCRVVQHEMMHMSHFSGCEPLEIKTQGCTNDKIKDIILTDMSYEELQEEMRRQIHLDLDDAIWNTSINVK